MKCSYCHSKAVLYATHFGKHFCGQHLENHLMKKLRRNLSKFKLVSKNDVILIRNGKSPVDMSAIALFKKAVERWPVKIIEKGNGNKVLSTCTLECETNQIIEGLASGEIHKTSYALGDQIKPFRDFDAKSLFVLGWLMGNHSEGKKDVFGLGVASKLNLIRVWDQILEFSE